MVNVATEGKVRMGRNPLLDDPLFRHFFDVPDEPRERKTQSLGSGVIVDAGRGLIITNAMSSPMPSTSRSSCAPAASSTPSA